jgi:hypothetical protein
VTARPPALPLRGLHLATLWTFAVAYPLYDVVGVETFFGVLPREIALFAVCVSLLAPLVLIVVEGLAHLGSPRLAWGLHLGLVGLLAAMFVSQLFGHAPSIPDGVRLVASLAGGAGFALAYARDRPARILLLVLSPAVALVLGAFLFTSDASRLGDGPQPARTATEGRVPVVMIVFDELPATSLMDASGRIDAARYPNFASLQRGATWFPNATTVHDNTHAAVPALLTGRRTEGGLPIAADHPDSVFTLLGERYRFDVSEVATAICPPSLCSPPRGFGARIRALFHEAARISANQLLPPEKATRVFPGVGDYLDAPAQTTRFLARLPEPDRPSLSLLHVLVPHGPSRYLPSGRGYPDEELARDAFQAVVGLGFGRWSDEPAPTLHAYQRHLLQLAYTDRLLGRIVRRLRTRNLYDRALLVVVADHGVSYRAGQSSRLGAPGNAEDILSVPLIVKRPGQRRGVVSRRFVRTIDVLPTIAEAVGARAGGRPEGTSVFDPGPGAATVGLTSQGGGRISLAAATFARRRDRAVLRKVALFGSGSPDGIDWIGRDRDLLGRRLAHLDVEARPAGRVRLGDPGALRSVDLRAHKLPVRITGALSGPGIRRGSHLAIALNGALVAAADAYGPPGGLRFASMVPEGALHDGRNVVRLLVVQHTGARRTLVPITTVD